MLPAAALPTPRPDDPGKYPKGYEGRRRPPGLAGTAYERRRPELTTLHRVVRENLLTLYAAVEDGSTGASLPAFVRKELDDYVACGLLSRGFARVLCQTPGCGESRLVAFSCGGRAFCPCCLGRRMAQTAANLALHVLPTVPLRQWVLTLPHELRRRLAYDGKLFGAVSRIFTDSVLAWYQRRLGDEGTAGGRGGAVVVMQRCSSDLRLHPHLHGVFLDGVYAMSPEGIPVFQALSRLSTSDVADVLQITRARVLRLLSRRGVVVAGAEAIELVDPFADREPVLAQLAAAASTGRAPAGPELRRGRHDPIALRGRPGVRVTKDRCVEEMGFTLHANTCAGALDERGREALLEYVLRPPIASENVQQGPEGLVRIALKRPFSDGTTAIDMDPLSLLVRLAAAVPPPRVHTVRYAGVLASSAKLGSRGGGAKRSRGPRDCSLVIPPPPNRDRAALPAIDADARDRAGKRSRYWLGSRGGLAERVRGPRDWAELLRRTFGLDPELCDRCWAPGATERSEVGAHGTGPMKVVALVTEPESIARYLRHLGEPIDPPRLSPARGPPYYQSRVLRRRPSTQQTEMFDA